MNGVVLAAVLGSALLHSAWNAIAKAIPDRLVSSALIGLSYLIGGGIGCLLLPAPHPASWPALGLSAAVQTAYLILLTAAYAHTDFSRAYPLTRGLAVVGVATISATVLGQRLSLLQFAGVAVVAAALLSLAWVGADRADAKGLLLALAVGAAITAYSITDGVGVRVSGNPLSYAAWLFLLQGITIPLTSLLLERDRLRFVRGIRRFALPGVLGGALSLVAYTVVVWAQSIAPLALVSALRETGVLMAGLIGWLFFSERFSAWRMAVTVVAVAGVIAIRLG